MTYTRNQNRYPEAHLNQHKPVTGRGRAKLNRESEPSNFGLLDYLLLKILSLSRTARRRLYKQQHTQINSSGTAKHTCINQIEHLFGLESTCPCRRTKQNWPQPLYSLTRTPNMHTIVRTPPQEAQVNPVMMHTIGGDDFYVAENFSVHVIGINSRQHDLFHLGASCYWTQIFPSSLKSRIAP
ncbi:hypothetical protein F2Q68_00032840 [Brassica cretica]|uniref:Uncharacterized protein n=1 Tax=Brassica cretica TaxID=69181 RepID=A0A8S9GF96_BRACR|nr:hypothetical protein F2Q68_00032840 [Brassica cretica]